MGMSLKESSVLAGWLSWLDHCPIYQRAVGSIPSQDIYLGCNSIPDWGVYQRKLICHIDVSLSLSVSLILSLALSLKNQ